MRKLPQTSKVKLGEENIKLMKSHTEKIGYYKCVHSIQGSEGLKNRS